MPTTVAMPAFSAARVSDLYYTAVATKDSVSELQQEVEELRGILRKISEKLQDNAEFDDELRRLLFSV